MPPRGFALQWLSERVLLLLFYFFCVCLLPGYNAAIQTADLVMTDCLHFAVRVNRISARESCKNGLAPFLLTLFPSSVGTENSGHWLSGSPLNGITQFNPGQEPLCSSIYIGNPTASKLRALCFYVWKANVLLEERVSHVSTDTRVQRLITFAAIFLVSLRRLNQGPHTPHH